MIDPALAQRISLVAFDVDGTLTDNGVYIGDANGTGSEDGRIELKRFDVQDGLGIVMLRRAGIAVAFVSARASAATTLRARELGVDHLYQGKGLRKLPVMIALGEELAITLDAMAFVGDDLADIAVMQRVGLSAAPRNSVAEVLSVAHLKLTREGGRGAAREFVELLLHARGEWDTLVSDYVSASAATAQSLT
jgi:3-deoxy-D-manno-octulosonate 8-phosphate phosphatase (KDO 8-P phosphatase)